MGRKIPGLIKKSKFNKKWKIKTFRITESKFKEGYYGFLMAEMLAVVGYTIVTEDELSNRHSDLIAKSKIDDYYFAIDLVMARCSK